MQYIDQNFAGVTVSLDGNTYRNCSFLNVVFDYAGGPLEMSECRIDRFSFRFGGDLAQGLFNLYQLFGTEGMLSILRGYTEPHSGEVVIQQRQ